MQGVGCGAIALGIAALLGLMWLQENPNGIFLVIGFIAAVIAAIAYWRKQVTKKNVEQLYSLRGQLREFEKGFKPIDGVYLSFQEGEFAFYERSDVALLEFKSSGSTTTGGYLGGNVSVSKNVSLSGGGYQGKTTRNEETSTVLDTGKAIFTNKRVVFVGPNHTREFDFDKLLDLDVSENGYTVRAAVSGRQKTSALQASAEGGLTPGFAFALGVELFQQGESVAKELAGQIASDIEGQYRKFIAGELK